MPSREQSVALAAAESTPALVVDHVGDSIAGPPAPPRRPGPAPDGPIGGLLVASAIAVLVGCAGHFGWGVVAERLVWDNLYDHPSLAALVSGGMLALVGLAVAAVTRVVAGLQGVDGRTGLGTGLAMGGLWVALGLTNIVSALIYAVDGYSFFEWFDFVPPLIFVPILLLAFRLAGAPLGWSVEGSVLLAGLLLVALLSGIFDRWVLGDDVGWVVVAGIPALAAGAAVLMTRVGRAGSAAGSYGTASSPVPASQQQAAAGQPQWSPAPAGTNGFAITSMVLGILGVSLLSLIFGFVALSQIKRDPQQGGRGMAIAGIVVSCCWIVVVVVGTIILFNLAQDATYDYYGDY